MKLALLLTALALTIYATASLITHFDADFKVSAIAAVLTLGAVVALEERDIRRRREIATWERGQR